MNRASRIGLYAGLALLGSWSVAEAQTPAARRTSGSSYYSRAATTSGRGSAYASSRSAGAGMYAENDPLRPYSAQARQSAETISSTRLQQAPPPPPRVQPQVRHNYYPGMQNGLHPNGNVPQARHHCIPSRGGVLSGSLGGVR